jgi:2-iminobutanoate/2-iminopropanoate deaminase
MIKKISTDYAPKAEGLLSQAVVANGFVFVAGQIHITPEGQLVEGTTEQKVHQIMKNITAILRAAEVELTKVVKVTVYVTDISVLPDLNKAYAPYFVEPLPVREAVAVTALPFGASIEISVVAEA